MTGRLILSLFAYSVAVASGAAKLRAQSPSTVFRDISVVTMKTDGVVHERTVVVRGGLIAAVGANSDVQIPEDATVIDGTGKFLMPGLWDMHIHASIPFEDAPLYLKAGVTSVLSLGTLTSGDIRSERTRSRLPGFMGPTLYSTGPIIQGGETPEEVEELVRLNASGDFDIVKVHGRLSEASFEALRETSMSSAIRVTGHAQRSRGMTPVYLAGQDLAHVEEYLYTFNPQGRAFGTINRVALLSLLLLPLCALLLNPAHRWRAGAVQSSDMARLRREQQTRVSRFAGIAWGFFALLAATLTAPYPGLLGSNTVVVAGVSLTAAFVVFTGARVARAFLPEVFAPGQAAVARAGSLAVLVIVAAFSVSGAILAGYAWKTSSLGLRAVAARTAEAGIWVTPNLVAWDYLTRQSGDEFQTLVERPGMRYLRPDTRDAWVNRNNARRAPAFVSWTQEPIRKAYGRLLGRLTWSLHVAGVPLLAGSDVGAHGVMPGESLHEELALLVEVGMSPYEALRTATTRAAEYLGMAEHSGQVAVGFQADLLLLGANPIEDIGAVTSVAGVMKAGRWYTSADIAARLDDLEEKRR